MKSLQEPMTLLGGLQNDADSKTDEEQLESGASMELMQMTLQMILAFE